MPESAASLGAGNFNFNFNFNCKQLISTTIMKDPKFTKEVLDTAIDAFAESIRECFKTFPIPAGMSKAAAADTYIRALAMSATNFGEEHNTTTKEYLTGIATSAFLVEHIDDIIAKVIENEGEQQTIIE